VQWLKRQLYNGVLLLLTALACWYGALGVWALYNRQWNDDRVSYRDPGSMLDFGALKELRRQISLNGDGEVTGWGQSLSEEITAYATSDSTRVDVIWLDGSAPLIWDLPILSGQYPGKADTAGCAIDEKTALKLFGTLDITGKEVEISGERMTVRGVFSLPEGITSIPSDPGRGLAFCPAALANEDVHMTALEFIVRPGPGETSKEQAEDWMQSAAMSTGGSMDDHQDTHQLLELFTSLPGYLLMVLALIELYLMFVELTKAAWLKWYDLKNGRTSSRRQFARTLILWCVPALALIVIGVGIARLPSYGSTIPASFLPMRWSDFSFWPGKAEELLQLAVNGRLSPALRPDLAEHGMITAGIILSLASHPLIWLATRALKRGVAYISIMSASVCAGVLIIAAPFSLWIVKRLGWIPTTLPGIAYLPIVFFAAFTILRCSRQSGKVFAWLFQADAGGMHM
jgi:hypothetical protein